MILINVFPALVKKKRKKKQINIRGSLAVFPLRQFFASHSFARLRAIVTPTYVFMIQSNVFDITISAGAAEQNRLDLLGVFFVAKRRCFINSSVNKWVPRVAEAALNVKNVCRKFSVVEIKYTKGRCIRKMFLKYITKRKQLL